MRHARLFPVLLSLLLVPAVAGEERSDRLAEIGRVWGFVKHAHPAMGSREIDWDGAAIDAISWALDTEGDGALVAATTEMLEALEDPATFVMACQEDYAAPVRSVVKTGSGALYVPPGAILEPTDLELSSHLILDLRPVAGACTNLNAGQLVELAPGMFLGTISAPSHRKLAHTGYKSQDPDDGRLEFYFSELIVEEGATFEGVAGDPRRTTFVVDERSTLPPVAAAMVLDGQAALISVGTYRDPAAEFRSFPVGEMHLARLRTSYPVNPVHLFRRLDADATEEEVIAAAEGDPLFPRRRPLRLPHQQPAYEFRYDDPYADMAYPEIEYRVLAAYRYWNVIEYFYAYKHLIGEWGPRLPEIIDLLINTSSREEYELALAKMTLFVPDGHSWAFSEAYFDLRGDGAPPFQTYPIEGKVIVTTMTHESGPAAGISLGDELLVIDGRPVEERLDELRAHISAANEGNLELNVVYNAPRGKEGSQSTMRFRRPDGSEYEATVNRTWAYRVPPAPAKPWRMLPEGVGYVDLNYLEYAQTEAMYAELSHAPAIIFDMRGYPAGSFVALAERFNSTGRTDTAQIRIPRVVGGEVGEVYRMQNFGRSSQPQYQGKTFMLIDERSQSAAEHTGLVMEAVADITFVGRPTSGSNGNISLVMLPGENLVMFTGMDVRHADGRQLQRVGLIPHVEVSRTIAGVAAGRDEDLEKAIELALE